MKRNNKIRNFCIIAHIDHGKSTLADRMIEMTGTREKRDMSDRVMDTLDLEQERGITIKLQTARMKHQYTGDLVEKGEYLLNLIDTPGHVDFSYEVSRSVAASEIALLLVDATQGIQAQTLSNMYKAMEYELKVIPVINKVDLPSADTDRIMNEMMDTFGFEEDEFVLTSAKTGLGVDNLINRIIEVGPPPTESSLISPLMTVGDTIQKIGDKEITKALIFDSFYHEFKGVVALVKVVSGEIDKNDELYVVGTKTEIDPIEIGYLRPEMYKNDCIKSGEVGYIGTGLKDIHDVHVGDTLTLKRLNDSDDIELDALPGYQAPKQMVFASLYPVEASDFQEFQEALEKLALNDAALTYERENSVALGSGFVCGFLGLLHLEVTMERLEREFNLNLISTTPTVKLELELATKDYSKIPNIKISNLREEENIYTIRTAAEYPGSSLISKILEPWLKVEIVTPEEYVGSIMELCQSHRGVYKKMIYTNNKKTNNRLVILNYELPSLEIIVNFFDKLKSATRGYASMDYDFLEYRESDIIKISILVNQEEVEALSFMAHKSMAERRSRDLVEKLAELIPRQQFAIPIQAAINSKVIARETVRAFRKDVTAKLYGGDITRKKKLLEKQKKGKKKLKMFGKVEIPKEAFLAALKAE